MCRTTATIVHEPTYVLQSQRLWFSFCVKVIYFFLFRQLNGMRTVRLRRTHQNQFVVYMCTLVCLTFTLIVIFSQCSHIICTSPSPERWFPVSSEDSNSMLGEITRNILNNTKTSVIKYQPFSTTKPLFIDQHDETLFWKNSGNQAQSGLPSSEQLIGRIKVLRNQVIHSSQNCGWQNNETFTDHVLPTIKVRKHIDYVCPLLVPQSSSFQHFVDGVLPKLMQVFHIVNNTQVQLMLYRSWDRSIEQMLAKLGIDSDRITYYDSGYYNGKYVLDTCVTPPLHPSLWNIARKRLGIDISHPVRNTNGYVVYVSRTSSRNYGRNVKNEEAVIDFLQRRYSYKFQMFLKPPELKETLNLFRNARILIGVHGGALYNVLFCPQETEIVEIMPTNETGEVVPDSLAHTIIWKMTSMLRQTYWRLSAPPENKLGDVKLNIKKLEKVLNIIDEAHGLWNEPV